VPRFVGRGEASQRPSVQRLEPPRSRQRAKHAVGDAEMQAGQGQRGPPPRARRSTGRCADCRIDRRTTASSAALWIPLFGSDGLGRRGGRPGVPCSTQGATKSRHIVGRAVKHGVRPRRRLAWPMTTMRETFQHLDPELQRRGDAVQLAVRLIGRNKVGDVANHEKLARRRRRRSGRGRRGCRNRRRSGCAASDPSRPGLHIRRARLGPVILAEAAIAGGEFIGHGGGIGSPDVNGEDVRPS
jgi:hypothetical protein